MREELRLVSYAAFSVATASVIKAQYLLKSNYYFVNVFSMICRNRKKLI